MEQTPYQTNPPSTPPSAPPKNWLVESILVTIFCCLPAGVVAIIFAAQVNSKWQEGDYEGARKSSKDAALWTKISFFVALISIVVCLLLVFVFGVSIWQFNKNDM